MQISKTSFLKKSKTIDEIPTNLRFEMQLLSIFHQQVVLEKNLSLFCFLCYLLGLLKKQEQLERIKKENDIFLNQEISSIHSIGLLSLPSHFPSLLKTSPLFGSFLLSAEVCSISLPKFCTVWEASRVEIALSSF